MAVSLHTYLQSIQMKFILRRKIPLIEHMEYIQHIFNGNKNVEYQSFARPKLRNLAEYDMDIIVNEWLSVERMDCLESQNQIHS